MYCFRAATWLNSSAAHRSTGDSRSRTRASSASSTEREVSHRWTSSAGRSRIEIDHLHFRESVDDRETRDARHQIEAARAGGTRGHDGAIAVALAVLTMTRTVDKPVTLVSGANLGGRRYAQLVAVTDMNYEATDLEAQPERQVGIADWIGVAADGFYRGDLGGPLGHCVADGGGVQEEVN